MIPNGYPSSIIGKKLEKWCYALWKSEKLLLGLLWALHFCKTWKVFIFNYGVWTKIESFFKWNMPLFFNGPCQIGIIDFLKEKKWYCCQNSIQCGLTSRFFMFGKLSLNKGCEVSHPINYKLCVYVLLVWPC